MPSDATGRPLCHCFKYTWPLQELSIAPDKRARAIDELLERPEHAEYWALKWTDLLKLRFESLGDKGTWGLYRHVRDSIAANQPFDQFVHGALDRRREHHRIPGRQLLPRLQQSRRGERGHGPNLLRHPAVVRQVPRPSVREVGAEGLLRHDGLLFANDEQTGRPPRRHHRLSHRSRSALGAPEDGRIAYPEVPRRQRRGPHRRPGCPRGPGEVAHIEGESVFRQGDREPALEPPFWPRDHRPG